MYEGVHIEVHTVTHKKRHRYMHTINLFVQIKKKVFTYPKLKIKIYKCT